MASPSETQAPTQALPTAFSLLTEDWIPLVASDGTLTYGSLRNALVEPQHWQRINTVNPIECIALHRLLLAICHRAIGPGDTAQRAALLDAWPSQQIDAYLERWRHRFDLLDPERPFLQVPGLEAAGLNAKSWTVLAPDRAHGAGRMLWDHSVDTNPMPITLEAAACALVAALQFSPGGLVRALRTSASAGPACKHQLVIPIGVDLQQTLALNLLPQTAGDYEVDLPAWETGPPAISQLVKPSPVILSGPAERYTFLSRAVQLLPSANGQIVEVLYGEGLMPGDSPITDPMTAMITGKKGPYILPLREDRAMWRDFHALTAAEGSTPPAVVNHAAETLSRLGRYNPIELMAGGLLSDQAKIILWRLEFHLVSPKLLASGNAVSIAQAAVSMAEEAGAGLRKALSRLFTEWLSSGGEGSIADKAAISDLHNNTQAMAHYWGALEPEFWSLISQLSNGMDGDEAITLWSNTIQTMIRKTWQHATDQLGLDGRALKAAAKANQSIGRVIASVSKGQP